ncbi:arabinose efflux permease family protein [Caldisphaera lagunensis DSM 15908]|uniref:Arabinose efflux permease family protein n=1 Tax=Caldisphaera lagunensis (strain DSM 15908 / JCM 11604 / ANMR 0165 / IC-154) TaxID=1056495 RepID=L0AD17_CALLD|nr:MFS transporter [Caldisphaera lagunensis]AFZ70945.1 arabinose efflux permease family protein [Caldisphaera lagunensis DSM 15908]
MRQELSIYFSRIIYAAQWYILAPATLAIAESDKISQGLIGFLPFAFIIGAATTQIPAAYLSSKIGPKKTFLIGLFILSLSDIVVSFTNTFLEAFSLRILAGLGAGLYFSPAAAVLVSSNKERSATLMGLYNAAFSIGGLIGLSWGILDAILGWRIATFIGGLLGLIAFSENLFLVKDVKLITQSKLVFDKKLVILGIATSGIWGSSYAVGTLIPSFASELYKISPYKVSPLVSLYFLGNIIGGSITYLFEKRNKFRAIIFMSILTALTYPLYGIIGIYFMAIAALLNGIFINVATSIYYALAVDELNSINESLSLSIINLINMVIGVWVSPLFSFTMAINLKLSLYILLAVTIIPVVLIKKL